MNQFSVGRIVHYCDGGPDPIAAIIVGMDTTFNPPLARLQFFWPLQLLSPEHGYRAPQAVVPFAQTPTLGHWSWPPREG
jgi:hypothetical protein